MKVRLTTSPPRLAVEPGFYYVSQDNYYIANLNQPNPKGAEKYLYCDSATSCIILIVEGKDKSSNPIVAVTHLSRGPRFQEFFKLVGQLFYGPVSLFAQGANPPFAEASVANTATLLDWIGAHDSSDGSPQWYISQTTLALGQGDPLIDDRSCYGIDLVTMTVTNRAFQMTDAERDPTGGVQTLFCVFGLQIVPPAVLHHTGDAFPQDQVASLVAMANKNQWQQILYMTKDEVLNKYSSTPQYEVPWFYAQLRESALFVKNYQPAEELQYVHHR